MQSIAPLSKRSSTSMGKYGKLPLNADRKSGTLPATVPVTASVWYALYAEGPKSDIWMPNIRRRPRRDSCVRGGSEDSQQASAEYFVKLDRQAPRFSRRVAFWRSQAEKDHVYAQFRQARSYMRTYWK